MKITRIETLPATIGRRPFVYEKVHTDEGIVGIGEAACLDKERPLLAAIGWWPSLRTGVALRPTT